MWDLRIFGFLVYFDFSCRVSLSSFLAGVVRENWAGVYIQSVLHERLSKEGKKKTGTEKDRGTIARRRRKWGVEPISWQCLALALSLVFGTFGTLFDVDS